MLVQDFIIPKYDWLVKVYYYVDCYYIDEIIDNLKEICRNKSVITRAYNNMAKCKLNTGFTYSNIDTRSSLMVISSTSTPAQFMNSYDHERKHLLDDIEIAFNIEHHSEESAYLCGTIGQLMFPYSKRFLCKCCYK